MPSRSRTPFAASPVVPAPATPLRSGLSPDSGLAAEIKQLMVAGNRDAARERFSELVARQQRRAVRVAYQYLRDAHDADEAVQDAFLKVFTHITSYREDLPFEVWFTRILINGCLDLRKARARRLRWVLPLDPVPAVRPEAASPERSVEDTLVIRERVRTIVAAVDGLPDRQRTVFVLRHFGDRTPAQIGAALGLTEATVRVHLFRAVRKLRVLLERKQS